MQNQQKIKEQLFYENLYNEAYEEIKEFEIARDKTKDEILKLIGYAIIIYGSKIQSIKAKKYITTSVISMLIKDAEEVEEFLEKQLMSNADKICEFYGYKLSKKEKQKIVNRLFVGLTYKDRKRQDDEVLKKKTHKLLFALILGKITLSKTQHNKKAFDKLMEKEYKTYKGKIAGILISEITRVNSDITLSNFRNKRVQYCSVLEKNTCADCRDMDGEIFRVEEAYDLIPQHRNCKCYFVSIEGDEI